MNLADPDFGGIIMRQDLQKLVVDSLPPEASCRIRCERKNIEPSFCWGNNEISSSGKM